MCTTGVCRGVVRAMAVVMALGLVVTSVGAETDYTFRSIAGTDPGSPYWFLGSFPTLNDQGVVVFSAALRVAGVTHLGIFQADGTTTTPVVTLPVPGFSPAEFADPPALGFFQAFPINNAGQVVWYQQSADGQTEGLYRGDGSTRTTIVEVPCCDAIALRMGSLNAAGVVAFHGTVEGLNGIFTGTGGPLTRVADTLTQFTAFQGVPAINARGEVLFLAEADGATPVPYLADTHGVLLQLAPPRAQQYFGAYPSLNDTKHAAWSLEDGWGNVLALVRYHRRTRALKTLADTYGDFLQVGPNHRGIGLTNTGQIVFYATLPADGTPAGLFLEPGRGLHAVVQTHDVVLGQDVWEGDPVPPLRMGRPSVNNAGQLVFWLGGEGRGGTIVLATPLPDTDGDGVVDARDACPGTMLPEAVPTQALLPGRYAIQDGTQHFATVAAPGLPPAPTYTLAQTAGCSCTQLIAAMPLRPLHAQHGCSRAALKQWIKAQTAQAP